MLVLLGLLVLLVLLVLLMLLMLLMIFCKETDASFGIRPAFWPAAWRVLCARH